MAERVVSSFSLMLYKTHHPSVTFVLSQHAPRSSFNFSALCLGAAALVTAASASFLPPCPASMLCHLAVVVFAMLASELLSQDLKLSELEADDPLVDSTPLTNFEVPRKGVDLSGVHEKSPSMGGTNPEHLVFMDCLIVVGPASKQMCFSDDLNEVCPPSPLLVSFLFASFSTSPFSFLAVSLLPLTHHF